MGYLYLLFMIIKRYEFPDFYEREENKVKKLKTKHLSFVLLTLMIVFAMAFGALTVGAVAPTSNNNVIVDDVDYADVEVGVAKSGANTLEVNTFDELKAALNSDGDTIIASGDITIPAGEIIDLSGKTLIVVGKITNNGTIEGTIEGNVVVGVMVYVVETVNPYPGVSYDKTATKNGSISGIEETVSYEISLDGGKTWIKDTTDGKAQAVIVKTDGTCVLYTSFQKAFTEAKTGDIVHMLTDAHVQSTNSKKNNGPLRSYYGLILEGNGHTIYTDLESSGASNEYATIKFTSFLEGTGPEANPVLKNVTIDSQNNAKADIDAVSTDVTFTVTMYNVNLLGNCQYASLPLKSSSFIINKSNVELYDVTIPSWDADSANKIAFYSGDYSLSLNSKCKVYGGTFTKDVTKYLADNVTLVNVDGKYVVKSMVAKIGETEYETLEAAAAAAQSGNTITLLADVTLSADITLPAGITLNGNGKQINGTIYAGGDLTFEGHTKMTMFNAGYNKPTITIGEGACLELTGTDRMVIGHGATFNITGSITNAKTANVADIIPSLIMPGASFTGAGVTFNVTNAYIKAPSSYCSSSKSASSTFDFNITNSIFEIVGKLAFESQSTAATVNFELKNSVLTTGSHLVFGVSRGEIIIDNSNVNLGTSRQIENQSKMTIKNGSVVNGAVATSSNAKNPGTIIVENATYAVTGEFSGSDLGTGTLIVKKGANVTIGKITKANIVVDATGMKAGDTVSINANLSGFTGTVSVINNDKLEAEIVDGKVVLKEKPVAMIGETGYATLEEAFKAATAGCTIEILADVTIDYKWDCRDYVTNGSHSQFKESVTINGNGHTIKFTGTISDGNWNTVFRFEENATINNLTIDISEATGAQRVISAKKSLTVDGLTIVGSAKYGIIFGEGASAADLAATEIVIKNSTLTGTRRAISDNEGGKDVKSVVIDNNKLNANVYVSASESVEFKNNKVENGYVDIRSYAENNTLQVTATDNTLKENTDNNYNYIKAGGNITAQSEFKKALKGSGTAKDPYQIGSVEDLIFFRDSVNAGETKYNAEGVYVVLTADIDLEGIDWSVNIGDDCNATFDGIFDGKDHTISNLTSTETAQKSDGYICTGLFGAIAGNAVIKNLIIDGAIINATYVGNNVGVVVGFAYNCTGSIENVKVIGNIQINAKNVTGTGVIVGYAYGGKLTIRNCVVDGTALVRTASSIVIGRSYVGGIIGYAGGKVNLSDNVVRNLAVTAEGGAAGGIAGIMLENGVASGNTVKNVELDSQHENWKNAVGVVAGTFTGTVTISNTVAEGNSTDSVVGVLYADKPTAPLAKAQAKIGDTYYATLAAALDAAKNGDTIVLLTPVVVNKGETLTIDKKVTITYTSGIINEAMFTNKGTLTIDGATIIYTYTGEGDATFSKGNYTIRNEGTLIVNSGEVTNASAQETHCNQAIFQYSGSTTINDGTISTPAYRSVRLWKGTMTINGGTFEGQVWVQAVDGTSELTINGGKFAPKGNDASSVFVTNSDYDVTFVVKGGTFDGKIGCSNATKLAGSIKGGKFTETAKNNTDTALLAQGLIFGTADENGYSAVQNDPTKLYINNLEDLKAFRDKVNAGNTFAGVTVYLNADIDLNNEEWAPIGTAAAPFKGVFDGQSYTISNLVINGGSNSNQGFFGFTQDGEIKNLTIKNAKVSGRLNVGVVAGTPYTSKFTNIKVTGHVEVIGMAYVGTVGGKNAYADWTNITVDVDSTSYVKATSTENGTAYRTYVGGVIGFIGEGTHTFKNISSNIKVIGDVCDIGGLFGIAHYGNKFENVTFIGSVEAPAAAEEVGGIAGVWHNEKGHTVTFTNVTSTGTVTIGDVTTTGSIVGGAYNASNETAENSGSLIINGKEAWICVAKIEENRYQTLADAIAAAKDGDTITLLADIVLTDTLTIDKSITLDGNGHKITQSVDCNNVTALLYFDASDVLDITIKNVTFDGIKGGAVIRTLGANMTIDNCVFKNCEHTQVQGLLRLTQGKASITNSKFINNNCSMVISFNYDTNGLTGDTFLVDNCVFEDNTVNGTAAIYYVKGAGCTIKNSQFIENKVNCNKNGATIYLGFTENCVVTGNLFKDNVVTDSSTNTRVAGAIFFGYRADISGNAFINNTASNAAGDVLGQVCTSTYYSCTIDLSGNYWGDAAPVYGKDYTVQHQTGEAIFALDNYYTTYKFDENGAVVLDAEVKITYVAQVGKFKYKTLEEAFAAAKNGDTITLLADIAIDSETFTIADGVALTLDMNGKKITVTDNKTSNYELFYIYGELTVTGNGTIELTATNNREWNAMSAIFHNRGGVLTIKNGTFNHLGRTDMAFVIDNSGNYYGEAKTNIEAGTFYSTYTAIRNRMEQNTHGASGKVILNISGGTIKGETSAIWAQAASTSTTSPATGEINISGGEIGLINTARSDGAVSMTTISGGKVEAFKGEVGELTVKGGTLSTVTILDAAGNAVDYAIDSNGTYVLAVAQIGDTKYATLADAIAAAKDGDTITLLDNVNEGVTISGKKITLDLNEKKIYCANSDAVAVNSDAEVTIKNGTLESNGKNCGGVWVKNAKATLENCTVIGTNNEESCAVYASNGAKVTINNCKLTANNCKLTAKHYALIMMGANVTINGGTFNAPTSISANGSDDYDDATLTINGGTFDGSIYWPANGKLTINDGTFTAETAIYIKSGSLEINGGTFTGNGEKKDYTYENSAFNPTGAAIVIENVGTGEYDAITSVSITGGKFISVNNVAVQSETAGQEGAITGFVSGGTFSSAVEEKLCAEGYIPTKNEEGTYGVKVGSYVAQIGETKYETLADAFAAAKTGDTVTLLCDVNLNNVEWEPVEFNGTFDGQGHTISNLYVNKPGVSNVGFFSKTEGGEIKNVTFENAKVIGRLNVGVVAGTPYTSKYTNITVTGHVEVTGMAYVGTVGGKDVYADWTDITVDVDSDSYVKANSVENGTAYRTYVGGVIGFIGEGGHTFKNISSNIKVIGNVCDIGGLFGIAHYGNKFENVTFTGSVEALEGAEEVGGIAGVWHNQVGQTVTFTNVTSTGTVTIGDVTTTGSIVGGAYNPDKQYKEDSGSLIIDGKEAWLKTKVSEGEDLLTIIANANRGDVIVLNNDFDLAGQTIVLNKGITLDLNGYTLTADYLVAFNGNHVIDSKNGTGLLNLLEKDNISLSKDNSNMAIWTGEGYKFAKATMQSKLLYTTSDGFKLKFRPGFSEAIYSVLNSKSALEDSGLKFMVRISWKDNAGWDRYQDFVCSSDIMVDMYVNNRATELTVTGMSSSNYGNITATLIATSELGVEVIGTVHAITLSPESD